MLLIIDHTDSGRYKTHFKSKLAEISGSTLTALMVPRANCPSF
jgi:hypothetical protein